MYFSDFKDLAEIADWISIDFIEREEPNVEPAKTLYENIQKGADKEKALNMALLIDISVRKQSPMPEEMHISLYQILAYVFIWNKCYEKAEMAHDIFLQNKEWIIKNRQFTEGYLLMIFVNNNKLFIESLLGKHPFIKTDFKETYQAYLSAILYPDSEELFDKNLYDYYRRITAIKQMFFSEEKR